VAIVPQDLAEYLKALAPFGRPVTEPTPEELVPKAHIFDLAPDQPDFGVVERDDYNPVRVDRGDLVRFRAFLDGVQRTVQFKEVPLRNGAVVPLHVAQVGAAVLFRDDSGRLFSRPGFMQLRLLLLFPLEGINDAGGASEGTLPTPDQLLSDTSNDVFDLNVGRTIFCDTTFAGIDATREAKTGSALYGEKLYDSGAVRSRAQGRVAVMRQILELLVLAQYRSVFPGDWILFDGPLFFLDKWRHKWSSKNSISEENLLSRAVGVIKTLRKRPRDPSTVLRLRLDERSPVTFLEWEVDIKGSGREPDEAGNYSKPHLCWFTRLRPPRGGLLPPTPLGLVRIDLHYGTLGVERADSRDLQPSGFAPHVPLIDKITRGVWRERWPVVTSARGTRPHTEAYPVDQVEKVLESQLLTRRALAYLSRALLK
jgi:hypothetical protein